MIANFYRRGQEEVKKIATLSWDGSDLTWVGNPNVRKVVKPDFDPKKANDWKELEESVSGSYLWVVVKGGGETALSMSDPQVEILGGPGSGHRGHKGVPGRRGGSAPGKGLYASLATQESWGGLSPYKKETWHEMSSAIPDQHVEDVKIEFDRTASDWLNQRGWEGAYISEGEGKIRISPDATSNTLAHETGHHVFHKLVDVVGQKEVNYDWERAGGSAKEFLYARGLRKYSLSGENEFFADSYSLWVQATGLNNSSAKIAQGRFRKTYPGTSYALDKLWGVV